MNVQEFFELSAGKWFSQKTSQHLTLKQSEHGKSDLTIEILPQDNPQIVKLCQQTGIDPTLIWGGAKYTWKGTLSWDTQLQNSGNQQGETIAILVPDAPAAKTGKLFHTNGSNTQLPPARYTLGDDDALTLVTTAENTCAKNEFGLRAITLEFAPQSSHRLMVTRSRPFTQRFGWVGN